MHSTPQAETRVAQHLERYFTLVERLARASTEVIFSSRGPGPLSYLRRELEDMDMGAELLEWYGLMEPGYFRRYGLLRPHGHSGYPLPSRTAHHGGRPSRHGGRPSRHGVPPRAPSPPRPNYGGHGSRAPARASRPSRQQRPPPPPPPPAGPSRNTRRPPSRESSPDVDEDFIAELSDQELEGEHFISAL